MTDQDTNSVSARIQRIRACKGLSQEELARQIGVSFPTVNAWERGKSQPYPRHRRAIDNLYEEALREDSSRLALVVEDDPSSAIVISDYVAMALPDWRVVVIDNGYEAMIQLGLLRPRLLLLDIMMPEIDGFKVFERVQDLDELRDTVVVFVTAATDEKVLTRARESGAALLQKPLDRERVVSTLQTLVES
jgi:CheY-like chemotaxis protein/DNA-binding XRE family transcriptional regulator